MDFMSCLFVLLGLAFLFTGIGMKLRKKDNKDDSINKHVEEAAIRKKVTIKPETPEASYGPITIFFGSQTGTAANYAKVLGEEAAKNGFKPKLIDLIDFDPEYLQSLNLTVFMMATHGEGEPTDNSVAFNQWLADSERTGQELKGQKFTVFGLGNKQYQFYNAQGRKVNQYMEKLGGERVYKYGEGDDDGTLEDDFNEWKTDLWEELKKVVDVTFVTSGTQPNESKHTLPFVLTVTKEKEIDFEQYDHTKDKNNYEFQMKQYLTSASAQITGMKELRQKTEDGSSLHIDIDCGSVGVTYTTAHNMHLFPENCPGLVEKASKLLKLDPEMVFTIKENKEMDKGIKFKYPFPTPLSVKTYLTKFCDLMGPIRKKQLKELAEFCPKNRDKEKLLFLASNNGKVEFEAQVQSSMLGLIDFLEMYEINIDLENLIQIASLIQPRYYTIASSNQKDPNTIRLCCTVHGDTLPNGTRRIGSASSFFTELHQRLKQGLPIPRIKIAVKESTFKLPTDNKFPVYMVGPGAGLAPFKGFIEEKAYLKKEGKENPFGEMTLYFGCRGRNWDYLYKEDLRKHHEEGTLENLHVAFSREKAEKLYVQTLIEQNKDIVCRDFFERNATVYICGAMGMGKSVVKKLVDFAVFHYKIDVTEATKKIEEMEKNKRIIKELWG